MPHPVDDADFMDVSLKDCCDMPFDTHSAAPIHGTLVGAMGTPSGRGSGNGNYYELVEDLQSVTPRSPRSSPQPSTSSSFDSALAQLASTHEQEVGRLRSEISQLRGEVAAFKARTPGSKTGGAVAFLPDAPEYGVETEEVLFEVAEEVAGHVMPEHPEGNTSPIKKMVTIEDNRPEFDSQRSSASYDLDAYTQSLPPIVDKWLTIVEGVLEVARTRRHYALREDWVKSDQFMKKMERQHGGSLDLQVLVTAPKKLTANRHSMVMSAGLALLPSTVENGKWLLHPSSRMRLAWVAAGMILVVYDIIVLPLNAFPLPKEVAFAVIQWFAQIFWTLDIILTFCTATYKDGDLVKDYGTVAKIYSRTWLPFDLIVVVPLWLTLFLGAEGEARSSILVKYARMLRFMRLARLAKLEKYLNEVLGALNSSMLLLFLSMVKLIIMMVVVVHFIACLWYAAGSANSGGWVQNFANRDLGYMYVTSMHWSFSQFQGTSDILPRAGGSPFAERCVATFTILISLVILSSFVSSLTNIMIRIQSVRTQMNAMDDAVRLFLSENDISWHLSTRVKKYVHWNQRLTQSRESTSKVVEILPKALKIDLLEETRGPLIVVHKLFATLQTVHSRLFRQICFEALNILVPAPGEIIFSQGEVCHTMYFITLGKYRYVEPLAHRARSTIGRFSLMALESRNFASDERESTEEDHQVLELRQGAYLSEACLWTVWEHFGILVGMRHCSHLCLEQTHFSRIAKDNPTGHASMIVYARRYVGGLNRFGKKYTDVIDNNELCERLGGDIAVARGPSVGGSATSSGRFWTVHKG